MTSAAPVLEAMDAYTGHWSSEQKTNRQGAAFHFEYDLEWVDEGETVASVLITRVMRDGSTNVVFEGVKGREPDGSGVYYWAVGPSGRASRGEVFLEGDRLITLYDGWTADGSVVQIRDVFMPVEGGSFVSHTYLRHSPEAEWRRIGEDEWARSDLGTS